MAEVEWKKRSISTAAAVYDGHDNDNLKKKQQQKQQKNKLDTDEFSTGRKFVCLGVPFTRNHANCAKISTLKSKTENFEAVRSKIWLVQCAHHTIRKYNSIQPTGTGKRTCLPRSFVKGNQYFPDVIMHGVMSRNLTFRLFRNDFNRWFLLWFPGS